MIHLSPALRLAAIFVTALAAAPVANAQSLVLIERTNVQTAPGHFTSAVTILQGAAPQVVRVGERGLDRATFWNDAALSAWAGATFGGRGAIYVEPDIPEEPN